MDKPKKSQAFGDSPDYVNALLFEDPNPFKKLDDATRKKAAEKIGAQARRDFESSLQDLQKLIRSCNPFQALAHLEYYDGTMLDQPSIKKAAEEKSDYRPVQQFALEFFQALFLSTPVSELPVHITPSNVLVEINKALNKLGESYMLLGMGEDWIDDDAAMHRNSLNRHIRHHTFAVRNAGFQDQVIAQLHGIFQPLDNEFSKRTGIELSSLIKMWENIADRYAQRLNEDIKKMAAAFKGTSPNDIITRYAEAMNVESKTVDLINESFERSDQSIGAAKAICQNHYERSIIKFYHYDLKDFVECYPKTVVPENLEKILRKWSVSIEGLVGENIERFLLDNPIWKRPIITHPELEWFFWPIPQIFHSFGIEMLENLLHDHPDLEAAYQSAIRADYLEKEVVRMLRTFFKGAAIYQNLQWSDPVTKRTYETDVLLVIDNVALIVECKSGKITPSARRGAPDRVRKEIKKLIEEASEQSLRFASLLSNLSESIRLKPRKGPVVTIDPGSVKKVIRLTVTLDFFGPLACDVRSMLAAGLLSAEIASAPTIALVDLDLILHMLPCPTQPLHYFARRSELEKRLGLSGDECDLLAFYMATGFNLGDLEFDEKRFIAFANLGSQLEPYMHARSAGISITKPRSKLTPRWLRLLSAFEARRFKGWVQASFILLSVAPEDQEVFEQHERKMLFQIASTSRRDDELNVVASIHGPAQRRTGLLSIGVRTRDREERRRIIENAVTDFIEREGIQEVLFLCHYVFDPSPPYVVAGLHMPKSHP